MAKYIDKSALVAEIEKRINEEIESCATNFGYSQGCIDSMRNVLSFIDTLEVKEVENFIWNNARTTVPEDSTNQIICIKEDGLAVSTIGKIINGTVKWAYLDDLLNTNSFNVEVKEVDLEKEIELVKGDYEQVDVAWNDDFDFIARHFYELGLKAQKGE
jgi:hypothetical protein